VIAMTKYAVILLALAVFSTAACSTREVLSGAGGAAAGYEVSNKRAMDELKSQRDAGEITEEEYERRKREIEKRSVVY
jgi:uncharacterized membrane protein